MDQRQRLSLRLDLARVRQPKPVSQEPNRHTMYGASFCHFLFKLDKITRK
jgi:hypothetical protein